MKIEKVGRSDPCPCGSGKKFKRCHGTIPPSPRFAPNPQALAAAMQQARAREYQRVEQQGLGRPIVSAEMQDGTRAVAVSNKLFFIKGKSFFDFLVEYIRAVLTPDWGNAELKKPFQDRHLILQWYDAVCRAQQRAGVDGKQVKATAANTATQAFFQLAYDLYSLDHNAELQAKLLNRIKNPDQYPGARYEIFVAASMIRAGFKDFRFEDEDDRSRKHCEFVATSPSGRTYSVEAKDRNATEAIDVVRPRIIKRLQNALSKAAEHERIVFINVDLPNSTTLADINVFRKRAANELRRAEGLKSPQHHLPSAYVVLTRTTPYREPEGPTQPTFAMLDGFKIDDLKSNVPYETLRACHQARKKHVDVFELLQSMAKHGEIPATFDGQSPEAAFGLGVSIPKVGQRFAVTAPDGTELEGTLEQAVADEHNGIATGVIKQDDGTTFIARFPLNEVEVNAYRRHPKTFFGTLDENAGNRLKDNYDLFLFFLEGTERTPHDELIERMKGQLPADQLEAMDTEALREIYAEGMTWGAVKSMDPQSQSPKE